MSELTVDLLCDVIDLPAAEAESRIDSVLRRRQIPSGVNWLAVAQVADSQSWRAATTGDEAAATAWARVATLAYREFGAARHPGIRRHAHRSMVWLRARLAAQFGPTATDDDATVDWFVLNDSRAASTTTTRGGQPRRARHRSTRYRLHP